MNKTLKRVLQVVVLALLILGALAYLDVRAQAQIGAGYVAHQVCSCVFVAERGYETCLPDLLPSMDRIRSEIVERDGRDGVRAWLPVLSDRIALHTPGLGCTLD